MTAQRQEIISVSAEGCAEITTSLANKPKLTNVYVELNYPADIGKMTFYAACESVGISSPRETNLLGFIFLLFFMISVIKSSRSFALTELCYMVWFTA